MSVNVSNADEYLDYVISSTIVEFYRAAKVRGEQYGVPVNPGVAFEIGCWISEVLAWTLDGEDTTGSTQFLSLYPTSVVLMLPGLPEDQQLAYDAVRGRRAFYRWGIEQAMLHPTVETEFHLLAYLCDHLEMQLHAQRSEEATDLRFSARIWFSETVMARVPESIFRLGPGEDVAPNGDLASTNEGFRKHLRSDSLFYAYPLMGAWRVFNQLEDVRSTDPDVLGQILQAAITLGRQKVAEEIAAVNKTPR